MTAPIAPRVRPARPAAADAHRGDIQGLRALAVILVILNHSGVPGFAGGYVGVDVFFVISGYVITQLLLRETPRGPRRGLSDFYSRRIRRIVPAATVTLVSTLLISYALLGRALNPNLPSDVRWASLFTANYRLIRTGSNYFVAGVHPSLITQFWSLAVEEQFYLFFPLAVFLVARFAPPPLRLRVLSGSIAGGIVLSAWWSAHVTVSQPVTAYYSPLTRFWELGVGCLLATLSAGRPIRTARSERLAVAVGMGLLVLALFELGPRSVYPGSLAWLPCLAGALLIWAGRVGPRNPVTWILSSRPLRYLGDISYSLYLTHYVWLNLPGQLGHPLNGWGWRALELAGTFATATLSYRFVEDPIRRSGRLAQDQVATGLVLAVCVVAAWAAAAFVGSRLPG